MHALTAAHRTLPLGAKVRLVNLETGASLILRVNDRGPYAHGRLIDVSMKAAEELGFRRQGVARVALERLDDDSWEAEVPSEEVSPETSHASEAPVTRSRPAARADEARGAPDAFIAELRGVLPAPAPGELRGTIEPAEWLPSTLSVDAGQPVATVQPGSLWRLLGAYAAQQTQRLRRL